MLFIILSILDVIAGSAIYSPAVMHLITNILWMLTVIVLFKGIYSIVCSFSSGYFFEWPGFLDVIAGTSLFLLSYDFISASHLLGGVVAAKGVYYLTRSVLGV